MTVQCNGKWEHLGLTLVPVSEPKAEAIANSGDVPIPQVPKNKMVQHWRGVVEVFVTTEGDNPPVFHPVAYIQERMRAEKE